MAKKAELLEKAKGMGLPVTGSNTIVQIEEAIKQAEDANKGETDAERHEHAVTEERHYAKSGKRSEKVERETVEKIEKEERKASGDTSPQSEEAEARVKKGPKPATRPRSERRGKAYKKAYADIDRSKLYPLSEAAALAANTSVGKFDGSVELHINLGVDPRQADQNIRSTVSLPHGTGKTVRVAVFAPEDQHAAAKKAGADVVGEDALLKLLEKEQLDFDVLISTPQLMPKLGKHARLLGPRGLMPNPKSGTVTTSVDKAVREAKAGKVEYRVDKQSIVHLSIGKASFGGDKIADNAKTFFDSLNGNKPASLKGTFIKSVYMTTTMGPSIKVDVTSL